MSHTNFRTGLIALTVLVTFIASPAFAAEQLVFEFDNLGEFTARTLVIDAADRGGDIVLQFGTTLNKTLKYESLLGLFRFNDDVWISGTASGTFIHAQDGLSSSGTLVFEGAASGASLYLGTSLNGAGLSDCDNATTSKLLWDSTTGRFSCGTDQTGGGSAGLQDYYVNVAGDTMTGALVIDPSSDAVQLNVQGYDTQSSNLVVIEDYLGTDYVTVDNDGDLILSQQIGIGAAGSQDYNSISNSATATNAMDGNDLFVEGTFENDGDSHFDGTAEFNSTTYFDGTVTSNDNSYINVSVPISIGSSTSQMYNSISNSATAGSAMDSNDLFVEGTFENDGDSHFDGTAEFNSTTYFDGTVTSNDNSYINVSVPFSIGSATSNMYNSISNSATATNATDSNDLFIEDILDVAGTSFFGALATFKNTEDTELLRLTDTTNSDSVGFFTGNGSPESAVTAQIGSMYFDHANGIAYIKQTDDGMNTGWLAVSTGTSSSASLQDYYVNVAGDTMTGALVIDPSSDAVQLNVQGYDAQSSNLVVIEDYSGTDYVTVGSTGNVTMNQDLVVNGNVDLGSDSSDTISFLGVVDSNIVPSSGGMYDLGSSSARWQNVYTGGLDASGTVTFGSLTSCSNGLVTDISGVVSCSMGGGSNSFSVSDSTTSETIDIGSDTLTFADGTDIDVSVSATDTVTVNFTNTTGYITGAGVTANETDPVYSANTYATMMNQGVATSDSPTFTGLTLSGLTNCDTIDTDGSGVLSCGTDDGGSGGDWSGTGALQTSFDKRYVNVSGDTMTGTLVIRSQSGVTANGLNVVGGISGAYIKASQALSASGNLFVKRGGFFGSGVVISRAEDSAFLTLNDTTNNDNITIRTGSGSPNGSLSAQRGSLFVDHASGRVYRNDDGAKQWVELLSGSGTLHQAQVSRNSALTFPNSKWTKVFMDTEVFDYGNIADVSTAGSGRITIRKTGIYLIVGGGVVGNLDTGEHAELGINVNNQTNAQNYAKVTQCAASEAADYTTRCEVVTIAQLNAGDYVELYVFHNEGAAAPVVTESYGRMRLTVSQIDGSSATNAALSGTLLLNTISDPGTPATGNVFFYGADVAGRGMTKVKGSSGLNYSLQPSIFQNNIAMFFPAESTTVGTQIGWTFTTAGVVSHPTLDSTNLLTSMRRTQWASTSGANGTGGIYSAQTNAWRGNAAGLGGFFFFARFGQDQNSTNGRAFVGLSAKTTSMVSAEPSAQTDFIGMGYDAADSSSGNWQLMTNDSSGSATKVDLGSNAPRDTTTVYDLFLFAPANGSYIGVRIVNQSTGTLVYNGQLTSDLPTNSTFLRAHAMGGSGTSGVQQRFQLNRLYLETDY